MKKLKVVIVDDHELYPLALKVIIQNIDNFEFIEIFNSGSELIKKLDKIKPDIVLTDIVMSGMDGFEVSKIVLEKYPKTKIVAVSMYDDGEKVKEMFEIGAIGYITKDACKKEFEMLFENLLSNKRYISSKAAVNYTLHVNQKENNPEDISDSNSILKKITEREKEVINYIAKGFSDKEIAGTLSLSPRTIDAHKQKIMVKMGTRKAAEIVAISYKLNIIK